MQQLSGRAAQTSAFVHLDAYDMCRADSKVRERRAAIVRCHIRVRQSCCTAPSYAKALSAKGALVMPG